MLAHNDGKHAESFEKANQDRPLNYWYKFNVMPLVTVMYA